MKVIGKGGKWFEKDRRGKNKREKEKSALKRKGGNEFENDKRGNR